MRERPARKQVAGSDTASLETKPGPYRFPSSHTCGYFARAKRWIDAKLLSTEILWRLRRGREEIRIHLSVPKLMVQVERLRCFVRLREESVFSSKCGLCFARNTRIFLRIIISQSGPR